MRVPLLDLSAQYQALAGPIRRQIDEVLQTQQFILGPKVEQFESALCDYTGAKFAIGVSSGTDGLRNPDGFGDWTGRRHHHHPVFVFATAAAIARVGATPLFVDIDPTTFRIFQRQHSGLLSKKIANKPTAW